MNLPGFKFWSTVQVAKNTRSIVRVSGLIYTVLVEKNVSRSRETTHRTTRTLVLYYAGTSVSCAPVQPSQLWCNSLFLTYFSACSFVVSWWEIPMSCTTSLEIVSDDRCRTEMDAETRSARDHAAAATYNPVRISIVPSAEHPRKGRWRCASACIHRSFRLHIHTRKIPNAAVLLTATAGTKRKQNE